MRAATARLAVTSASLLARGGCGHDGGQLGGTPTRGSQPCSSAVASSRVIGARVLSPWLLFGAAISMSVGAQVGFRAAARRLPPAAQRTVCRAGRAGRARARQGRAASMGGRSLVRRERCGGPGSGRHGRPKRRQQAGLATVEVKRRTRQRERLSRGEEGGAAACSVDALPSRPLPLATNNASFQHLDVLL